MTEFRSGHPASNLRFKDTRVILSLYKSLVLVLGIHDKDLIEKVQRRFTKMINNMEGKSYEERLYCLKLWTSLSATNTISSSCLPKKSTSPASYLQPPRTPNVFGKQSINSYTTNPLHRFPPPILALHLQTALLPFSQAKYPNSVFLSLATLPHHLRTHPLRPPATPPTFSVFTPASEPEVYKILSNCPNKQCDSDPIPTWLLKECS